MKTGFARRKWARVPVLIACVAWVTLSLVWPILTSQAAHSKCCSLPYVHEPTTNKVCGCDLVCQTGLMSNCYTLGAADEIAEPGGCLSSTNQSCQGATQILTVHEGYFQCDDGSCDVPADCPCPWRLYMSVQPKQKQVASCTGDVC